MKSEALLLYFSLLHFVGAGFPEDSEPISIAHGNYTKQYPVFLGHKPGRNNTQRHKLDIQLIVKMNRTLYIAARDHIYTVELDTSFKEQINFNKKLTWRSKQADIDICRMKGKHKDECHNFIKVLLKRNDDTLFVCGTNAFNPSCRNYKVCSLISLSDSEAENNVRRLLLFPIHCLIYIVKSIVYFMSFVKKTDAVFKSTLTIDNATIIWIQIKLNVYAIQGLQSGFCVVFKGDNPILTCHSQLVSFNSYLFR